MPNHFLANRLFISCHLALAVALFVIVGCSSKTQLAEPTISDSADDEFALVKAPSLYEAFRNHKLVVADGDRSLDKLEICGRVLDTQSQPVANAVIECWGMTWLDERVLVAQGTSNNDGTYSLDVSRLRGIASGFQHSPGEDLAKLPWNLRQNQHLPRISDVQKNINNIRVDVMAVASDESIGWEQPQILLPLTRIPCDITLRDKSGSVFGTVVGPDKKPLVGIPVGLSLHPLPGGTNHKMFGLFINSKHWNTSTDEKGRFAFRNLPAGGEAFVRAYYADRPTSFADATVWTSTQHKYSTPSEAGQSNPCVLMLDDRTDKVVFGKVNDPQGNPVEGVELKIGEQKTSTSISGDYRLAVRISDHTIQIICPSNGRLFREMAHIDNVACRKGNPQPPIVLFEGEWITGRVISKLDEQPIGGISVMLKNGAHLGTTLNDGSFRVLAARDNTELRFVPGWLTRAERELKMPFQTSIPVEPAATPNSERELGDVPIDVPETQPAVSVKVLLPSGETVKDCLVKRWLGRSRYREKPFGVLRTQNLNGNHSIASSTDETGTCHLTSLLGNGETEYITVAYPKLDPSYFGELQLTPTRKDFELRLTEARPMRGKITYNGVPLQGACVQAEPVNETLSKPYKLLCFDGISDGNGNYEVFVPGSSRYEIKVLPGVLLAGAILTGNDLITVADGTEKWIQGPDISIRSGKEKISGVVLGRNGKVFSGARVQLKLLPGQIIDGMVSRDSNGSDGAFAIHGLPEGSFDLFAGVRPGMPQDKVRPDDFSNIVNATTGDTNVILRLPRHSR